MPDIDELENPPTARPIWSGTVSFGLVSVPVNLISASPPRRVALHMVADDGRPLARRYFRAGTKTQLASDDIVRGYEVKKGKFVTIEDDELERLAPERTRDIDLQVFVEAEDIDPMYCERAYYLAPANPGARKPYKLLAAVMEEMGRAGVATFVMREKEYLAAILAENGILRLETLRFADEVRSPKAIGLPEVSPARPADVKRIAGIITRLTKPGLDKREMHDTEQDRLKELAKRKARSGENVVRVDVAEEPETNVVDLMERLQKSLSGAGNGRKRKGRKAS